MLYRSITERIEQFFEKEKKAALMVTGPADFLSVRIDSY